MAALVSITLDSDQVANWVIGLAALLAAIALLWRYVGRPLRAIWHVIDQEMTNDHGSSMKDDVHGIAVTVGMLSRDFDKVKRDLYTHLAEKEPRSQ